MAMRSNKNTGAGTIILTANGTQIASKNISHADLSAPIVAYSGTVMNVDELTITLIGTQNSLYVDTFVVSWSPAAAREVVLMKGDAAVDTLREANGGEGVLLPAMDDEKEWTFVGWARSAFWQTSEKPIVYNANSTFYPEADCSLWAVYRYEDSAESTYQTELVSGTYLYVNETTGMALTGVPVEGRMGYNNVNTADTDQHYHVEFMTESTATITHEDSNTPIGYDNYSPKLTTKASVWNVYHEGDQMLFWATISNKNYVLWLNVYDTQNSGSVYAGLLQTGPAASPMRLLSAAQSTGSAVYTCHPECGVGIESVEWREERGEWKVVFGIYEIYIRDGKKYLKIQ